MKGNAVYSRAPAASKSPGRLQAGAFPQVASARSSAGPPPPAVSYRGDVVSPAPIPVPGPSLLQRAVKRAGAGGAERGALSLELAFLAPAVMLILFTTIQAGLYAYARDVAITAAQQGVEAARVQGGTLAEGEARTRDLLNRTGGSITGANVTGTAGALVQITVTGRVDTWIPGLSFSLAQTATAAKEEVPAP